MGTIFICKECKQEFGVTDKDLEYLKDKNIKTDFCKACVKEHRLGKKEG
jgi:hypothetical protein